VAAFAREQGLEPHRVHYWRERIEPKGAQRKQTSVKGGTRRSTDGGKLIPGVVVVGAQAPVRVQLGGGVVVEARSAGDLEPGWLAELAQALEQLS
jgi:hypothetical protein